MFPTQTAFYALASMKKENICAIGQQTADMLQVLQARLSEVLGGNTHTGKGVEQLEAICLQQLVNLRRLVWRESCRRVEEGNRT